MGAAAFSGNTEYDTHVYNDLPSGTVARYVRLIPATWQEAVALRWELVGCAGASKQILKEKLFATFYHTSY